MTSCFFHIFKARFIFLKLLLVAGRFYFIWSLVVFFFKCTLHAFVCRESLSKEQTSRGYILWVPYPSRHTMSIVLYRAISMISMAWWFWKNVWTTGWRSEFGSTQTCDKLLFCLEEKSLYAASEAEKCLRNLLPSHVLTNVPPHCSPYLPVLILVF
jgi:hypothetical protein